MTPEDLSRACNMLRSWGVVISPEKERGLILELMTIDSDIEKTRRQIRKQANDGGTICPVCDQHVKVYRRKVNSSMTRGLIAAYRAYGTRFGYLQDVRRTEGETDNREESKLRYWGLMQEEDAWRPDGGRAGYWRVTDKGEMWIRKLTTVPKYAVIYNGECLRLEGQQIDISEALGDKFNYRELMNG